MRAHLAAEHPRELRYLRISAYVVLRSLFGIVAVVFGLLSAQIANVIPSLSANVILIWIYVAIFAWIGLVLVWGVVVDPRLEARARAAWRATHVTVVGDDLQ